MLRALVPAFAVGLPIVMGMVLLYFFIDGAIGIATVLAGGFAIYAAVVTALMMHGEEEQDSDSGPWLRH
jgi:hypothetical protein